MDKIIVTRHAALVDYLREQGIVGDDVTVISHARPEDVKGRDVIGVLPLNLAALAASVTEIPLRLTPEMRGQELGLETLRQIAGKPVKYKVTASAITGTPRR
jgi:putative CRISPR-associated protein (TIGR02620 family)